jgi:hypothetical protein
LDSLPVDKVFGIIKQEDHGITINGVRRDWVHLVHRPPFGLLYQLWMMMMMMMISVD